MVAGRAFRWAAGVLGLAFGGTALAQTAEIEAELKLYLAQLRLSQQPQQPVPKARPGPAQVPADAATGAVVARLGDSRLRHAATPVCVVFSPDGKRVFTGGEDGVLRVWDTATGDSLKTLQFPNSTPAQLRFTHGGTRLAVSLADGRVRFLNPATLAEVSALSFAIGGEFDVSADGSMLAAFNGSGFLTVTEMGNELPKVELPPSSPFAFHPGNKTIAVADRNGKISLHMLAGGKPVLTLDHGAKVTAFAIRPDGKQVATAGPDGPRGTVKVWDITDAKNPKVVAEFDGANQLRGWVGTDRVAAGDGSVAGVYDLAAKKWIGRVKGVSGPWAASPDGMRIASIGTGGLRVRLWDVATGKQLHADNDTFPDARLLAPAADGKSIFLLAGDAAFLWPISQGTATPAGTLPGKVVAADTGGGRLAVATADAVLLYDEFAPTKPLGPKPARTLTEHAAGCRAVAVSLDGRKVAYTGNSSKTVIADAATGKTIRVLPVGTVGLALAFTHDGEKLVTIGRDGYLRFWATSGSGQDLWKLRIQSGQRGAIAVSPDGKLIAGSSSGLVKVVTVDGREVFTVGNLFEHGLVTQAAFSPDSRLLYTATEGSSGAVQVWEVATRTIVARLSTGFGTVHRIGLFADGTRLASAGMEEVVTVWGLTGRTGKEPPKADELLAAWGKLDSQSGADGVAAVRTLIAGGAKGLTVVAAGLEETAETKKNLAKWTKNLGAEEFADREAATKELTALGVRAVPALYAVIENPQSPESKKRAGEILDRLSARGVPFPDHGLAGDTLRIFRATEVLEKVGGPEATALLKRVEAFGGPAGDEAKAALKRIAKD